MTWRSQNVIFFNRALKDEPRCFGTLLHTLRWIKMSLSSSCSSQDTWTEIPTCLFLRALSADSLSRVAAAVSWELPWIIQWDLGGPGVRESGKHWESWGCSPETGLGSPGLHMRLSVAKISNSFMSTEQLAWAWPFPPLGLIFSSRKKSQNARRC